MAKKFNQIFSAIKSTNPLKMKRRQQQQHSSGQARNAQTLKCNCCETPLSSLDKEKSFIPKYGKCAHCQQHVCRNCRENSRCHECNLRLIIVRDPDQLMKLSTGKLLRYLKTLHYPDNVFDNWEKPFLVKQLLTRFQVHENWDPSHYMKVAQWALAAKPKTTESTDPRPESNTTVTFSNDGRQSKYERVGEHIYSLPSSATKKPAAAKNVEPPAGLAPRRQWNSVSHVPSVSLRDIPSANYFEGLSADEMKSLLKASIDSNAIMGPDELKFILQVLWTNMRKAKNETSGNPADDSRQRTSHPKEPKEEREQDADGQFFQYSEHQPPLAYADRRRNDRLLAEPQLSASMGALNMLDARERHHQGGHNLPVSSSFRENPSAMSTAAKRVSTKNAAQQAPVQQRRRVKDMKALFETQAVEESRSRERPAPQSDTDLIYL